MIIGLLLIGEANHGENVSDPTRKRNKFNIVVNVEEQNKILTATPNIESMTGGSGERFIEDKDNVIFPKIGFVFHKSFAEKYKGMIPPQARRSMKGWFTHREKDEIIHYLIQRKIIRFFEKGFKN